MAKKAQKMKLHAIMLTLPYQGHISPFVNLALKLAAKGFKVTFLNTEYAHHCITQSTAGKNNVIDIFAEARNSAGLDIDYRTISDGFALDYDRLGNFVEYWEYLLGDDFPEKIGNFVREIIGESPSPELFPIIVADTFARWAAQIAERFDLPSVSFWTQPALVFAATYYKDRLVENGHFPPPKDGKRRAIDYIPGVDSMSSKDLPSHFNYEAAETLNIVQKIVFLSFDQIKKADFVLHNTVQELEPTVLSSLDRAMPTYSIGPTNFFNEGLETLVPKSLLSETDCSKWLDEKPSKSVLYVSFGSLVDADERIIEEIARGLVLSDVDFLWITRNNNNTNNNNINNNNNRFYNDGGIMFPKKFRDGVSKGKGLVVPWCDQRVVLSHSSIGGFLTHCGWNSTVESMWFGVPMICYPVDYDQPTNRKLVVDDWKIGTNLYDENGVVNGERLAEKIKKVMDVSVENEMRREMKKVKKILRDALGEEGSSEKNFDRFVDDLKVKIHGFDLGN